MLSYRCAESPVRALGSQLSLREHARSHELQQTVVETVT